MIVLCYFEEERTLFNRCCTYRASAMGHRYSPDE